MPVVPRRDTTYGVAWFGLLAIKQSIAWKYLPKNH